MKSLYQYIKESYNDFLKLSSSDRKKLLELDIEYGKIMLISRYESVCRRIDNIDDEWEKFERIHIKNSDDYFPVLRYDNLKYNDYDLKNRTNALIGEFEKLNCFLSQYYVDNLNNVIYQIEYLENIESDEYELLNSKKYAFSDELLDEAFKIIDETETTKIPETPEYQKKYTGQEVIDKIQGALDEYGYDWKIIVDNKMPPRMGVNPEKTFRIRKTAKFSDVDIDNLIAHEIKGHVQKRYNAYKKGLFLFVFGLPGKNIFDEGMAIWNTINITEKPKPNAMFNIAFSYIACYYCSKYNFCETFDKLKELVEGKDVSDKRIFATILRSKRSTIRTDRLGYWSGDIDYFRGFKLVDEMTTAEREKIIQWNIGPKQYYNIDTFERFLKINNIKSLSNEKLAQIKKDYKDLKE